MWKPDKKQRKTLLKIIFVWTLWCVFEFFLGSVGFRVPSWLLDMFGPLTLLFGRSLLGWLYGVLLIVLLFWYISRETLKE